jgi:hypothetical protein
MIRGFISMLKEKRRLVDFLLSAFADNAAAGIFFQFIGPAT